MVAKASHHHQAMDSGKSPVLSVGIIVFALGVVLFSMKFIAEWNGAAATATVASIRERSETDSTGIKTYYEPSVWFTTHSGDTVNGFIRNNEGRYRYKVGQQIRIVYKLDDVTRFHVARSFLWYVLFVAIIISGIAIMYFSTKLKSEKWD